MNQAEKNLLKFDWKMLAAGLCALSAAFSAGYYFRESQMSEDKIIIKNAAVDCKDFCKAGSAPASQSEVASVSTSAASFVAGRGGTLYHKATCLDVNRIASDAKLSFSNEEEAQNAGYQPHECVEE